MKKILYKASGLLLYVSLMCPTYASALDYQENYDNLLTDFSEIVDDNLSLVEPEKIESVIVDAKKESVVEVGTIIDANFIKENVINRVSVSDDEISLDQVDIAISSQVFTTANEQQVTYTLSGGFSRNLATTTDFIVQEELKVTFEEATLTAKPNAVTTVLGTKSEDYDLYTFVKEVKLGNQYLTSDQYQVFLQEILPTDTTGLKKVNLQVVLNEDPSKMINVETPITVRWGQSLAISGEWTGTNTRRIVSALTLHSGPSISMEPGQGASSLDFASLPTFKDKFFSTVSFYHTDESGILNLNAMANRQFSLNTKDTPKQIKEAWNHELGERVSIEVGDIIQIWHGRVTGEKYERPWLYFMANETFVDDTAGLNDVYYEVTETGFKLIQLNRLSTAEKSVPIYTNTLYFDEHIDEFIDSEGLSNISKTFLTYPDTTSSGKKEAIIRVEQMNSSGKKVQYDYSLEVTVEEGELSLFVPQVLMFTEFKLRSEKQLIERNSDSFELSIKDSRGAGLQGNYALSLSMNDNSLLSQYVVYKDSSDSQEQFLNHSAIPIFNSTSENSPKAPSEIRPLNTWNSERGLFLSIPANEPLKAETYAGTLNWTLTAGPET